MLYNCVNKSLTVFVCFFTANLERGEGGFLPSSQLSVFGYIAKTTERHFDFDILFLSTKIFVLPSICL
jgi:hypothetical protein